MLVLFVCFWNQSIEKGFEGREMKGSDSSNVFTLDEVERK
jgi:hypothetical protein